MASLYDDVLVNRDGDDSLCADLDSSLDDSFATALDQASWLEDRQTPSSPVKELKVMDAGIADSHHRMLLSPYIRKPTTREHGRRASANDAESVLDTWEDFVANVLPKGHRERMAAAHEERIAKAQRDKARRHKARRDKKKQVMSVQGADIPGDKVTWPPPFVPKLPKHPDLFFQLQAKLGEGSFAIVTKVTDSNGDIWARKLISNPTDIREKELIVREIQVMKRLLGHRNILRLDHTFMFPEKYGSINLLVEFCRRDLQDLIKNKNPLIPGNHKYILLQLLNGLAHMHSIMIAHRDLKPANILMTAVGELKIADFGTSRFLKKPVEGRKRRHTPGICSYRYAAPEIFCKSGDYDSQVDMWSAGVIGRNLYSRNQNFLAARAVPGNKRTSELNQLVAIQEICGEIPSKIVEDLPYTLPPYTGKVKWKFNMTSRSKMGDAHIETFLPKLLTLDPDSRLTAKEALQADYFKSEPLPKRIRWND